MLGEGGFGQVIEVVKRDCGVRYAMKVMMKDAMKHYNLLLPANHIEQLILTFDTDGDGMISYEEFCEALKSYAVEYALLNQA